MLYIWTQNNVGGSYIENDVWAKKVVIEARTRQAAINKSERLGLPDAGHCSCCGDRFNWRPDYEVETIEEARRIVGGKSARWFLFKRRLK